MNPQIARTLWGHTRESLRIEAVEACLVFRATAVVCLTNLCPLAKSRNATWNQLQVAHSCWRKLRTSERQGASYFKSPILSSPHMMTSYEGIHLLQDFGDITGSCLHTSHHLWKAAGHPASLLLEDFLFCLEIPCRVTTLTSARLILTCCHQEGNSC